MPGQRGEIIAHSSQESEPCQMSSLSLQSRLLDPKDRQRLVDLLLGSVDESSDPLVEEAWRLEIRKRVAAYESGNADLYDEDQVMVEAKRIAP